MSQSGEQHHHSGSKSRWRRKLFGIRRLRKFAPLIAAVILIPAILFAARFWEAKVEADVKPASAGTVILPTEKSEAAEELTFFNGKWYTPKKGLETTLILGTDKNSDFEAVEGGRREQADFLMLMVADDETKSYTGISINRDTMTDIMILTDNGVPVRSYTGQIALSHSYGNRPEIGCKNTIRSLSGFLGVDVDHYISMSMDGVAVLNDLVGGVPVLVLDDFSGIDDTLVQGETVLLRGDHALAYIRARGSLGDPTNVHRMERQQQYMASLQSQFSRRADENADFITDTMLGVSDYLVSDCTVDRLSRIIEKLHNYESEGVRTIKGEVVYRDYAEFYPDEQALRQLIMDVFYESVERT